MGDGRSFLSKRKRISKFKLAVRLIESGWHFNSEKSQWEPPNDGGVA